MTWVRIGNTAYPTITQALKKAKRGDQILIGADELKKNDKILIEVLKSLEESKRLINKLLKQ
jgi:hypothetical protein